MALRSPPSTGPAGLAGAAQAGAAQEEHLLLLSGPAGSTLDDHLACFSRRARRPSRCHADKLPGPRLSAGLIAHQTPLPGFACSAAPRAQSSPKHRQTFTHSIFHSQASRHEAKLFSIAGPNTILDCRPDPPPPLIGWGRPAPLRCEPARSPLWGWLGE